MKVWKSKKQSSGQSKRGMKDKNKEAVIFQWLIPIGVLLLAIVIMLANYIEREEKAIQDKISNLFTSSAAQYSTAFYHELETISRTAMPVSMLVEDLQGGRTAAKRKAAMALQKNSNAVKVIVSDSRGNGMNGDGKAVELSHEAFFEELKDGEQQYIYTRSEDTGESFIISVVPIVQEESVQGYIFSYYDPSCFEKLINKMEHDNASFYGIVTEDGTFIESYGADSSFVQELAYEVDGETVTRANLFKVLEKADIYEGSNSYIRQRIQKLLKGSVGASYDGEKRMLFHAPLHVNGWQIVMGVNQSYLDTMKRQQMSEAKAFVGRLIAVLCAFFALVVIINVFNRLRFKETSKALENQADTDLLTGLNNKIATERKIKSYINETDQQALIFLLDIDNFKKINDTMGHAYGDKILRELGHGLAAEFRMSDILGRTGGDEFMIFLKNIKDETIVTKEVNRVVRFFHDLRAGDGEYVKYAVTASIGCAVYPRDADNFEDLYKAADKALYKAKKRGKNQLALYAERPDSTVKKEKE